MDAGKRERREERKGKEGTGGRMRGKGKGERR